MNKYQYVIEFETDEELHSHSFNQTLGDAFVQIQDAELIETRNVVSHLLAQKIVWEMLAQKTVWEIVE